MKTLILLILAIFVSSCASEGNSDNDDGDQKITVSFNGFFSDGVHENISAVVRLLEVDANNKKQITRTTITNSNLSSIDVRAATGKLYYLEGEIKNNRNGGLLYTATTTLDLRNNTTITDTINKTLNFERVDSPNNRVVINTVLKPIAFNQPQVIDYEIIGVGFTPDVITWSATTGTITVSPDNGLTLKGSITYTAPAVDNIQTVTITARFGTDDLITLHQIKIYQVIPIIVSADTKTITFGTPNPALTTTIAPQDLEGLSLQPNDTLTITITRTFSNSAGTYPITPEVTQSPNNNYSYTITVNTGNFIINKADRTFSFTQDQSSLALLVGDDHNGYTPTPETEIENYNVIPATTRTIEIDYSASDPTIVRVDDRGGVTAIKAGQTTIRAFAIGNVDYNAHTASYTLYVLGPPENLIGIPNSTNTITLSWDSVAGADYYEIYRSTTNTPAPITPPINSPTNESYIDSGLSAYTIYYYWVRSCRNIPPNMPALCSNLASIAQLTTSTQTPLNDTGITFGVDNNVNQSNCTGDVIAAQDCSHGRDKTPTTTLTKVGAGAAGFDFSKLDSSGNPTTNNTWECVTDNHTGLTWQYSSGSSTFNNISTYISTNGTLCGRNNWRLPTLKQLDSITHRGATGSHVIDTDYFINPSNSYWSSSLSSTNQQNEAWSINFGSGKDELRNRTDMLRIRLVSPFFSTGPNNTVADDDETPTTRYTINNDGTVTDHKTDLMWQICSIGQTWSDDTCMGNATTQTWTTALQAADNNNFINSNWRLPNIKELRSIVAYNENDPAINSNVFPMESVDYWSSSPERNSVNAWVISFVNGGATTLARTATARVRLVRDVDTP